jgi:uncharacterized integral membrane protein
MEDIDEKEIQKKLEEMKRKAEEFQSGISYSSHSSSFFSSPSNSKLILTVVGVIIVLILSAVFYIKNSSQKVQIKIPPGYEIVYPKGIPPRLQQKL